MRIVVLAGGLSTEREVSISSGCLVAKALAQKGHEVVLLDVFTGYEEDFCDIDALFKQNYSYFSDFKIGKSRGNINDVKENRLDKSNRFIGRNVAEICGEADITFLALHGGEGENGQLQATLDLLGIKYTGAGYLGSALAMNKGLTKSVLIQNDIRTPQGKVFGSLADAQSWNLFPCVVKPCSGGSSVGIAICNTQDEYNIALKNAFEFENEIVVEQFVKGREFSVGLLGGKALPPIEIIPKSDFYDYESKYQAGATTEVCPADIDAQADKKMRTSAEKAYKALRLESYARIDFLLDENGNEFCLEANTLPGMTPTSLLPQEAAVEGMDFATLCEKIIEISLERYNRDEAAV